MLSGFSSLKAFRIIRITRLVKAPRILRSVVNPSPRAGGTRPPVPARSAWCTLAGGAFGADPSLRDGLQVLRRGWEIGVLGSQLGKTGTDGGCHSWDVWRSLE